jgi:hypothetical protein
VETISPDKGWSNRYRNPSLLSKDRTDLSKPNELATREGKESDLSGLIPSLSSKPKSIAPEQVTTIRLLR